MTTGDYVTELRCTVCSASYPPATGRYTCPTCGEVGTLDVRYDYATIAKVLAPDHLALSTDRSMWRYRALLPVENSTKVTPLEVGGTPLVRAERLAGVLGVGRLRIKDEGRQPTGSLKDRASAVALARASQEGADVITTASTGNAAAALAGLAASTGQRAVIFVPDSAPEAKVAQLLAYAATVVLVEGNYDAAFRLCTEAVERFGWYNRNTGVNPYVGEGKKTVALEIAEQCGWRVPDAVFVGVGDGSIIGGVHKGFADALALGWTDRMPRLFGVQAAGSDFMVAAAEQSEDVRTKPPIDADTVADSISADLPRDRVKAAAAVSETDGAWIRVQDEDILSAIPLVAGLSGVFPEPAAAAPFAGLRIAVESGMVGADDDIVAISTGTGLKDVAGAMRGVELGGIEPIHLTPGADALKLLERGMKR